VIFRVRVFQARFKKEKKSFVAIQGSQYDGSTYYRLCVTIIFTTSLVFFHKRFFITILLMVEGKFLINDNTELNNTFQISS